MQPSLLTRFVPSTATPNEAYRRATRIPRVIREFADAMLGWAVGNLESDELRHGGTALQRYGFRRARTANDALLLVFEFDHGRRFILLGDTLYCGDNEGAARLRNATFEPAWGALPDPESGRPGRARPPATPLSWLTTWNCLTQAFELLADYERFARRTIASTELRQRGAAKPKSARRYDVTPAQLPSALLGLSEWCADSAQAMLTWIIAEAGAGGKRPEIPALHRYRGRRVPWFGR